MLMASYGWTLDDCLDLTLPQTNALFRSMSKAPTPASVVAGIVSTMNSKSGVETALAQVEGVAPEVVKKAREGGQKFLKYLGVKTEDTNGG